MLKHVHSWPTVMMHNCLSCMCDRIMDSWCFNKPEETPRWITYRTQLTEWRLGFRSSKNKYQCFLWFVVLVVFCSCCSWLLFCLLLSQVFLLFASVLFTQKAWSELCFCCNVIVTMILSEIFFGSEVTRLISGPCIHYHVVMRPFPAFLAPAAIQALPATCCFTFCMSSHATLFSSLLTLLVCDWLNDITCSCCMPICFNP